MALSPALRGQGLAARGPGELEGGRMIGIVGKEYDSGWVYRDTHRIVLKSL